MLSIEAEKAQQEAASRHRLREARMDAGPILADDGVTLIIPSEAYNPKAAAFWRSEGFRWHPEHSTWERDTRRPRGGKRFSPQAWLRAARQQYAEFWPDWEPS